ncbi:hypothetical protein YQE_01680, partial [Dendroctonus ponderosae]
MPPNDANLGYAYQVPTGGWTAKVRNALSQFSDIFSEFDKYIAPAYHHDRCERSVQMRLYSMNKREFVMIFILFFACFGLTVFIGLAGPPITETTAVDAISILPKLNNATNFKDIATGPFIMKTPKLSTYNQQLWIIAKMKTQNTDEHKPAKILTAKNHQNRTHHLRCDKQACDEFIVMHLGYLDYTHYMVNIAFYDLETFHATYNIRELYFHVSFSRADAFQFKTYNPDFTQIEVWFRLIFLIGAFGITWWFCQSLRKYPVHCWSFEQKWVGILLPLLMAFDNPFFPMMFLMSSWLPGMLDALFQATFLAALFLFWLSIYHGLRQNERNLYTFYLPKIFVVSMMYVPTMVVKAFFYIFGVIYLAYLGFLILKAYSELRSMPFFGLRLKFLTLLMLVVLVTGGLITAHKFGVDILEDNFVAQLGTHYSNSEQFMSFYGLLNLYVYTMAYVYSPQNKSIHDQSITKDNPAFSMINDSDEDVIYGSDEESRRPLNRGHNDDDSD